MVLILVGGAQVPLPLPAFTAFRPYFTLTAAQEAPGHARSSGPLRANAGLKRLLRSQGSRPDLCTVVRFLMRRAREAVCQHVAFNSDIALFQIQGSFELQ